MAKESYDKTSPKKSENKTIKSASKAIKKTNGRVIIYALCFIIFALAGYFGASALFSKDKFVLNAYGDNAQTVTLNVGDNYEEMGATLISFGKDKSSQVNVIYYFRETEYDNAVEVAKIDTNVAGIYYAQYTNNDFKYKSGKLIRTVIIEYAGGDL